MPKKDYFPRVKEAREALRDRAIEILESYLDVINKAKEKGDNEAAIKGLQWLIEHMPEEEGAKMVDTSVDKNKQVEGPKGPSIQIGIALGGMASPKQIPQTTIIDVDPDEQ